MTLRRNLYYSFIGQWVYTALAFCTTVLISRLLTPHEIGVFAIALSVAGVVGALQDFGTKQFIIQKVDLDVGHRRAAFGVGLLTGLIASLLVAAASIPIARSYDTPELAIVTMILATNPLLNSLYVPISSMLERERLFLKIRAIAVISAAVSAVTAVTLSYLGFSFYSLAIASLASAASNVISHCILGRRFVIMCPALRGARAIFSFGTKVYLANVLMGVTSSARVFIIGKLLGISSAAIFNTACSVGDIYSRLASVDRVLTAEYAAQNRMGGNLARAFLSATGYMSAIAWPFFGTMAVYADPWIRVLYGSQWTAAIVPMQVVCIGLAFWPLNSPAISVIVGTGAVDLNLRIRVVTSTISLAMTVVAAHYSLNAVALTIVISAILSFVLYTRGARQKAPFTASTYVRNLVPSAVTSLMALAAAAVGIWLGRELGLPSLLLLFLGAPITVLGWLAGLFLTSHPLLNELHRFAKRGLAQLGILLAHLGGKQTLQG